MKCKSYLIAVTIDGQEHPRNVPVYDVALFIVPSMKVGESCCVRLIKVSYNSEIFSREGRDKNTVLTRKSSCKTCQCPLRPSFITLVHGFNSVQALSPRQLAVAFTFTVIILPLTLQFMYSPYYRA